MPDTLVASAWQSAVCEYALLEIVTDAPMATTTQNARSQFAANELIVDS